VQQHILDDSVCALAVLHDLVEIVAQSVRQLSYFTANPLIERRALERLPQLIDQFSRDARKIVDKVEWILDFVGDSGGQLAKRGKLLCLNEAVLRRSQILQRFS
jgi:hypothetical protein